MNTELAGSAASREVIGREEEASSVLQREEDHPKFPNNDLNSTVMHILSNVEMTREH